MLLSGLIDYAGLFPPAKLPLDEAIRSYLHYAQGSDAWMLGRFVIPATRLNELDAFADLLLEESPFCVTVLGRAADDPAGFLSSIADDQKEVKGLYKRGAVHVEVEAYEVRLPLRYDSACVSQVAQMLAGMGRPIFFEGPPGPKAQGPLIEILGKVAFARADPEPGASISRLGLKFRCGGLDASAVPTVDEMAFVIHACREAGVPLKFTAGLHHPIRRYDAGAQTHALGFVNVFVAGVLAHACKLDQDAVRSVLADEDPTHFTFTEDYLAWMDVHASRSEIGIARGAIVTSFGSCSFDEPRDDLRALGWL